MKLDTKENIAAYLLEKSEVIKSYCNDLNPGNVDYGKNCLKGYLVRLAEFVQKKYDAIENKNSYTPSAKYNIKFGSYEELIEWSINCIGDCANECDKITSGNVAHSRASISGMASIIIEAINENISRLKKSI